jgi:hypothetical protein
LPAASSLTTFATRISPPAACWISRAARREDPHHLGQTAIGVGKVPEAEPARDGVDRAVRERQRQGVGQPPITLPAVASTFFTIRSCSFLMAAETEVFLPRIIHKYFLMSEDHKKYP